ncbi:MAG: energy transducer TonB [Gemmatimonadetes bacterium]|nr:energy transducer TonB [Gemmatimonadota bacterium]|tara:strand:+ start:1201 stop:1854 length:654 start_codon:yes stop_codon:yes gene_type:complete
MIRGKQPEANLRLTYRKMLWSCVGASVAIHGVIFALFPTFEADAYAKSEDPVIIQLEEIPETKQERRPPPPARPVVPVATDNPDVADDVTIEDTDIDLDLDDFAPPPPMEDLFDDVELEEEEEIVELWKVEKQPIPTKRAVPQYPDIARKANITGKVFVTALVNKTGKVESIGKITGPEVFHEAARAAAKKWEFEPAIQNDKPVKVWVSLPFTFQLN